MTDLWFALKVVATAGLTLNLACVDVPIELTVGEEIDITEAEVDRVSQALFDNLSQISFAGGNADRSIDPRECSKAYKKWLTKQFVHGLIPKKVITPSMYAIFSDDPNIAHCRAIDFSKEFDISIKDLGISLKEEAKVLDLGELREEVARYSCAERFFDPSKDKIRIEKMWIDIVENTLSVSGTDFTLYTSPDILKASDLNAPGAKEYLLTSGALTPFAYSPPFPPRFVGRLAITPSADQKTQIKAQSGLLSLEGSLIAVPQVFEAPAQTKEIEGEIYYVIPRGRARARIKFLVTINAGIGDALCLYNNFMAKIKEEGSDS